MAVHPDLEAEQAYINHAYRCLERARTAASKMQSMVEVGRGGTEQARYERDVIWDATLARLKRLQLGDASLCFGRIDQEDGERYYIGRVAVADDAQEPVVVDWRAPVAEPFYRATGRQSLGLERRRHFTCRGRELLDLDDERFDVAALAGDAGGGRSHRNGTADGNGAQGDASHLTISGYGSLISALETERSGRLLDIVATIQGEQDEIIRAPLPGVLVVQGGPGTGKTVVALHRAAYLLYTHRFPLEDQGVLVVGPNRLFLAYIEQVLPSLGEAGVDLIVLADLVGDVRVHGDDAAPVARVKGDARMAAVLAKAVQDRERALPRPLRIGYGLQTLVLTVEQSARIVADARRRFRTHNAGRRFVEQAVADGLAASSRTPLDGTEVRDRVRRSPEVREALERMWPVVTPAELLHDLFGSRALLALAGRRVLDPTDLASLHRPRSPQVDDVRWAAADVPLLDEARALLGPTPKAKRRGEDKLRTFGHIVVDEAQDLSPMQLRMVARRSLNGSLTVVGDIAQSTGAWAHGDWDEVLSFLPDRKPANRAELTVGYRIPAPNMALAARVLAEAAPGLAPPRSVRQDGRRPLIRRAPSPGRLGETVAEAVRAEVADVGHGNVAVICPASFVGPMSDALTEAGIVHGRAGQQGLDNQVTVVPVGLVKGLELDATVVVEPAAILREETQGLRALYVSLTRATKLLTLVHAAPLPSVLAE